MPADNVVLAIRHVFDLVVPTGIGLSGVRSGADNDVARHLRMNVAQQRHNPWSIKREWPLFALWPRPQVVSFLLVAADRGPEHVVLHVVTVLELHRCSLLHDHDMRAEHQTFLVHNWFL